MPTVTYFHVELAQHDILLAEGLPAESYLDTGNRTAFENAGSVMDMHPDLSGAGLGVLRGPAAAAPLAVRPEQTEPLWRRLHARAEALGHPAFHKPATSVSELRLAVAGREILPSSVTGGQYVFVVPLKADAVQVMSRSADPSDIRPWLDDRRRLGVSISRIVLKDGRDVSEIPVDHPALGSGWHDTESDGQQLWRWTNGNARLPIPVGTRVLEIHLCGLAEYPILETVAKAGELAA
jgi:hypothetical protein